MQICLTIRYTQCVRVRELRPSRSEMGCAHSTGVVQESGTGGTELLSIDSKDGEAGGAEEDEATPSRCAASGESLANLATSSAEVIIYGNSRCGWCRFANDDFTSAGIAFRFADVDEDENDSEMWEKAESAGFGLDGTIGLPMVDIGGVIRMRPSSDDVLTILHAPPPLPSSSIRQFRSVVNRLHAVHRMTLAKRTFNPAILPGVSTAEDEQKLRAMFSEMDGFDNAVRQDLEAAQHTIDQEKAQQAQRHEAQLKRRTEKAAEKLHGKQGAPTVASTAVSAVVRWTNRAVIAHENAVTEVAAAAATENRGEGEGEVIIYGRDACGWCQHVAAEFTVNGIAFRKVDIDDDAGSAEMWQKVRANPEIGNNIGLPVVDVQGNICVRPTAEDVLTIRQNPPSATAAGGIHSSAGDDCAIISHEDGSREGGKPALLSLEAALALAPISNFYGADGPQDARLTVYGAFTEMSCKLHCPTRGPLVTGVPFQLCLVAGIGVKEVGVLADGEFPVVACLKPKTVQNGMNVFFGEMLIAAEASELTFYNVSLTRSARIRPCCNSNTGDVMLVHLLTAVLTCRHWAGHS